MDFVDDVDLEAAFGRLVTHILDDLADLVDAAIGRAVDLKHVDRAPVAISSQWLHWSHGVAVGPFSQFNALARIRAAVVLPTPRTPVKR